MIGIAEIKSQWAIEDVFAKLRLVGKSTGTFQCPFHDKHAQMHRVFWEEYKWIKYFGCDYSANLFFRKRLSKPGYKRNRKLVLRTL